MVSAALAAWDRAGRGDSVGDDDWNPRPGKAWRSDRLPFRDKGEGWTEGRGE